MPDDIEVMVEGSKRTMVVTVDARELMVILFEAMMELKRPPGTTVAEALDTIRQRQPDTAEALRRMANAAMEFVADRMAAAVPEQPEHLQ